MGSSYIFFRREGRGESNSNSHTPISSLLIFGLGLIALVASWRAVSNYVSSLTSVSNLELEMRDVQWIDDDGSQVILQFRMRNRSPLAIRLNSYFFELYLNGERIGGSNSAYLGTDSDVDQALYSRASTIEQTLAPHQHLDLVFPLYVYGFDQIMAERQGRSEALTWSVQAGFRLIHPYAREERLARLQARLQE